MGEKEEQLQRVWVGLGGGWVLKSLGEFFGLNLAGQPGILGWEGGILV